MFEAMMALTNLSSVSAEAATRIARAAGLTNKVELLMLEDHTLVRRATTELVCNLISGSEDIFNRWGGDRDASSPARGKRSAEVLQRDDSRKRSTHQWW